MDSRAEPSVEELRAVSCWYAPWRHAHASWLAHIEGSRGRSELARRMAYGLWCSRAGADPHPPAYDGSIWWRLLQMPAQPFFTLTYLVGMVLVLATDARARLSLPSEAMLRTRCSADDVRWALQRSCVALQAPLRTRGWGRDPEAAALRAVRIGAEHRSPALAGRMCLRFPHALAQQATTHQALQEQGANTMQCAAAIERLFEVASAWRARAQGSRHESVLQAA
jgi:hypothetical protein